MAPTEVELLVRAAAGGDEESWRGLVDRYSGMLWSVVRSYRLDNATSADVVQEVWVRLAQNLERIREPARVGSWLATTAKRESLRVIRMQDRQRPTEFDENLPALLPDLDSGLLEGERDKALLDAFSALDTRCRQLLRLVLAEPTISYEDIGALLDMPVGSIGPTRARCLAKLRNHLERGEMP